MVSNKINMCFKKEAKLFSHHMKGYLIDQILYFYEDVNIQEKILSLSKIEILMIYVLRQTFKWS